MARELQNDLSRNSVGAEAAIERSNVLITYILTRMLREERTRARDARFDQE